MKLQARFLVIFMSLFGVVALLLLLQQKFDSDRSTALLKSELTQHRSDFQNISEMDQQRLKSLAIDYSYWDDMVDFVDTSNPTFARDNIDPGLATYGADAAWVYRLDGTLVYYKSVGDSLSLTDFKLPPDFFAGLRTNHFKHFYYRTTAGLVEVRAATIHPGSDPEHLTPPRGYWLVGRLWGPTYLADLSKLTQSRVKLGGPDADAADHLGANTITFSRKLEGWDGSVQGVLTSTSNIPIVDELRNLYIRQLSLVLALGTATVLMLIGAIWYMVLSPLRVIHASLKTRNPAGLDHLARQHTEFGALAQTVQQFFAQDQKIQENTFVKSKLVELNRAKSEFLAIAAHELKGSIGNVHVFAENLAELIAERKPRSILVPEVQRISHQARKATVLINDIYQASKGGKSLSLNRTQFDLDEFIREEISDAQYSTAQKIVLTGFTAAQILSDRDRLGQVMSNLLRNASKYSPPDSNIRVALRREGTRAIIEVQDKGIGIPAEEQSHVFERFFRSARSAQQYPGLGLGLSICKEIVEALGGQIWFTSEVDHGSTFVVSLPLDSDRA